ncbi:hypothetical protein L1F30_09405 [Simiduia sp. 21SJ11W-1]|uniref:hypothetical protein n=1 Tax=Simiduia sp. 21SJ11W-1 TaxID=2909669 RepID=UPI00209FB419|nr:hypothetical protein [Simiduia sp. 21SJ11W-1]UTA46389.1 hypothetical protein L1F30_09405 [Simiduia sp. 21SJ11W-1]
MTQTCISDAIEILEELSACLDDAYWEAATIGDKDRFYNLIYAINRELSELSKLSVQDHNLAYERISQEFTQAKERLSDLKKSPETYVRRSRTAQNLSDCLHRLDQLLR